MPGTGVLGVKGSKDMPEVSAKGASVGIKVRPGAKTSTSEGAGL